MKKICLLISLLLLTGCACKCPPQIISYKSNEERTRELMALEVQREQNELLREGNEIGRLTSGLPIPVEVINEP